MMALVKADIFLLFDSNRLIRKRALFLSSLILAVTLLICFALYYILVSRELQHVTAQQETVIFNSADHINRELGDIARAVRLIAQDDYFNQALSVDDDIKQSLLNNRFKDFSLGLGNVMQIRWLDQSGLEIVRVDYHKKKHQAVQVPADKLQDKSDRYYFQEGMAVSEGEVYLSDIDLNVEYGEIVKPIQPMIRASLRTGQGDGLHPGLLIINYDLSPLFKKLSAMSAEYADLQVIDQYSYWLLNPDKSKEWGRDQGQLALNVASERPKLWRQLQQDTIRGMYLDGQLLSAHHVVLNKDNASSHKVLTVLAFAPQSTVTAIFLQVFWPVGMLFLLLSVAGFYLVIYELRNQKIRYQLMDSLLHEKNELEDACTRLETSMKEQQVMQDELVETRKLSALGMMVAGVAHELNTPLGGALMMTSGLTDACAELKQSVQSGLTRSALEQYLQRTDDGLELLTTNLQQAKSRIVSFKRLAIDRFSEEAVSFTLRQVIDDLMTSMRPILKEARVSVDVSLNCEAGFEMYSYPGVISQVVQNLMMNSVNHAFDEKGGEIRFYAECHDGTTLVIHYSDDGKGIPESMRTTLFDPFVTTGRGSGSTGLGLHLVQQWVSRMLQGSIRIEPTESGRGLGFCIRIPVRIRAND